MRRIVAVLVIVVAAKAWAYRGRPVSDLRFDDQGKLIEQKALAVEAGFDGYLAAWFEDGEVRATRIDAAGNYLDGEGIFLGNASYVLTIAIDGSGPYWFVVWAGFDGVHGRSVSRSGVADAQTVSIGTSYRAALRWDGAQYVVLMANGVANPWSEALYLSRVSVNGIVDGPHIAMQPYYAHPNFGPWIWHYSNLALVRVGNRLLAVFAERVGYGCWSRNAPHCLGTLSNVLARYLDGPLFAIGPGTPAVAANGTEAFIAWASSGTFISGDAPDSAFTLNWAAYNSSVAFSQTEFVVAGYYWPSTITTARVRRGAGVTGKAVMRNDAGEWARDPSVAGNATFPALIGFIDEHPAYDGVPRGMLLFAGEIDDESLPPAAPANVCATLHTDGTATLTWDPLHDALGISAGFLLPDGSFRQIAVAPGGATSARVSLAASGIRDLHVRAWNAGGLSAAGAISGDAPTATMRSTMRACPDAPATISFTLTGTPPFTVHWYDGVVQKNLHSPNATREVTLKDTTTLSIVKVEDRSCAINETPEKIRITVDPVVALAAQTQELRIRSGESATLTVTASNATQYAWFEGPRGDTSHPVGLDSFKYTTPPLKHSTQYWVRVSNRCGSVDSEGMNVLVAAKRRAA